MMETSKPARRFSKDLAGQRTSLLWGDLDLRPPGRGENVVDGQWESWETGGTRYDGFFADAIARLQAERRYRIFADLERIAGRFPHAIWHSPQGPKDVVVWCSNDYLG